MLMHLYLRGICNILQNPDSQNLDLFSIVQIFLTETINIALLYYPLKPCRRLVIRVCSGLVDSRELNPQDFIGFKSDETTDNG